MIRAETKSERSKRMQRDRVDKWKHLNPIRLRLHNRKYTLKRRYGITPEQYDLMLESQDGHCALCPTVPTEGNPLYVDHDHLTTIVRGLLCRLCNWTLGTIESKMDLGEISTYLKRGEQ
ncbi:MAG: endonuclease VII domain-containing protein [Nitrospiraceae bacterium]